MKLRISTLILVLSAFTLSSCTTSKVDKKSNGYVARTNGSFSLRPYKEVVLENGLKVIYVPDTTLPRVSLTLMIKAGALQEPTEQAGLNAITAYLLEQGTQSRDAMKLADQLGQLGTNLDVNPGYDVTTVFGDSLSVSKENLLELFSDIVMNPSFKDSEIGRIRSQLLASIQKKVDNPSSFADEKMNAYLFGEHPYGRDVSGTRETVQSLGKQAVIKHYLTYYRPNNSSLAVVGNFDEAFEKKVQETFGKWTKRTIPVLSVKPAPENDSIKVRAIVKKGLQQTQIRISELGIPRKDPDYLTLRLANEVLGGSFASRLNQKIRDDQGLTYSIYSYFDVKLQPGSFDISTFTKNETAGKAVDETVKVVNDFITNGVTAKELEAAKSQLVGQFPRAIETADRFAYNLLILDFFGVPVSYLTDFNANVKAISLAQVNGSIKKKLNPQGFKILIYGDDSVLPQIQQFKPEIVKVR